MAHAVPGLMDECAGEIATRLHIYEDRSCADVAPQTSASHKIPVGSSRHHSYIVTVIRVSAQYCSPMWSTLLIPANEGRITAWGRFRVGDGCSAETKTPPEILSPFLRPAPGPLPSPLP